MIKIAEKHYIQTKVLKIKKASLKVSGLISPKALEQYFLVSRLKNTARGIHCKANVLDGKRAGKIPIANPSVFQSNFV